jgi:hypothetical protein
MTAAAVIFTVLLAAPSPSSAAEQRADGLHARSDLLTEMSAQRRWYRHRHGARRYWGPRHRYGYWGPRYRYWAYGPRWRYRYWGPPYAYAWVGPYYPYHYRYYYRPRPFIGIGVGPFFSFGVW